MSFNKEQEKYVEQIAEKINNGNVIRIEGRAITTEDIKQIGDYDRIATIHPKGFEIFIRKDYHIELFLNIPTLMFNDKYTVDDELFGNHNISWKLDEIAEYANGLLGY